MEGSYLLSLDRNAEMAGNTNQSPKPNDGLRRFANLSILKDKWEKCSAFEKVIIVAALAVVLLCLVITIILTLTKSPSDRSSNLTTGYVIRKDKTHVNICEHKDCTLAAADILNAMDEKVDPCGDFVNFACGGWVSQNAIPEDSSSWDQFNTLRRRMEEILSSILEKPSYESDPIPIVQLKHFYAGCLNDSRLEEVGLQPLVDLINTYGGWPITDKSWKRNKVSFTKVLGKMRRDLGANYIYSIYVRTDNKNTLKNALYIDQPTLGLPRSVLVSPEHYQERVQAYKLYIKSVVLLISSFIGATPNKDTLDRDIDNILEIETVLASLSSSEENRRDINKMYNPVTVERLQKMTSSWNFDWLLFIQEIFSSTPTIVTKDTRVLLMEVNYIQEVSVFLSKTDERILMNYILWRIVKNFGDETIRAMREASMRYNKIAFGVKTVKSRYVVCSGEANTLMGMAVGLKYIENYFPKETKAAANNMIEDIKDSFMDLLDNNEWMDHVTNGLAKEKLDLIANAIGYPDWYHESTGIEKYYKDLDTIDPQEHFKNVLTLSIFNSHEYLNKLDKAADRTEWYSSPSDVNAYYEPAFNSITFPAGILQPPFYRALAPQYLNYGGIGQVIGHEITHGFDDQGRQFNKEGNAIPWWTNETIKKFKEKINCIHDQYQEYRIPELDDIIPNATMNGKTTLGENIADNGGLRAAYNAYVRYIAKYGEEPRLPGLTKYTPKQLFFISNAQIWCSATTKEGLLEQILRDPHSPPNFRIMGPISNMKEFADVWSCSPKSEMNPSKKCIVW